MLNHMVELDPNKMTDDYYGNKEREALCRMCGWKGELADLDFNDLCEPAYCPVCGSSDVLIGSINE